MRIVQRKFGWREVGDEEDWEIYWTDTSVSIERVMKLSRTQVRGGGGTGRGKPQAGAGVDGAGLQAWDGF